MHAKRISFTVALTLAASVAVALCAMMSARGDNVAGPHAARIAVVDVTRAFNGLKEKLQMEADLQTRSQKLTNEAKAKEAAITAKKDDLKVIAPGTPDWQAASDEYETMSISLKVWSDFQKEKLQSDFALEQAALYRKILAAIAVAAKDGGYDLVLFKEQEADFKNVKPEAINTIIQVRKVLYSAPELDITDQITTMMNNDFANMVKPASTQPAGQP